MKKLTKYQKETLLALLAIERYDEIRHKEERKAHEQWFLKQVEDILNYP